MEYSTIQAQYRTQ